MRKKEKSWPEMVLVSACLLGIKCRYDGTSRSYRRLKELLKGKIPLPVCPEQLGGLTTPRPPAEISSGDGREVLRGRARIYNVEGQDVTKNYLRGAKETMRIAHIYEAKEAIFQDKSPACGVEHIVKKEKVVKGKGVVTAALEAQGIKVIACNCF